MSTKRTWRPARWQVIAALLAVCAALLFTLVDGQGPRLRHVEYTPAPAVGGLAQWRFYVNQSVKSPASDQVVLSSGTFYSVTTTNDVVTVQTIERHSSAGETQTVTLRDLEGKYTNRRATLSHTIRHPDTFLYTKQP